MALCGVGRCPGPFHPLLPTPLPPVPHCVPSAGFPAFPAVAADTVMARSPAGPPHPPLWPPSAHSWRAQWCCYSMRRGHKFQSPLVSLFTRQIPAARRPCSPEPWAAAPLSFKQACLSGPFIEIRTREATRDSVAHGGAGHPPSRPPRGRREDSHEVLTSCLGTRALQPRSHSGPASPGPTLPARDWLTETRKGAPCERASADRAGTAQPGTPAGWAGVDAQTRAGASVALHSSFLSSRLRSRAAVGA